MLQFFHEIPTIEILIFLVFVFLFIDFVSGIAVSVFKKKTGFRSLRAWQTIAKVIGAEVLILLSYCMDEYILNFLPPLFLANIFSASICLFELWSIIANFSILSDSKLFDFIRKIMKYEIEQKLGNKRKSFLDSE